MLNGEKSIISVMKMKTEMWMLILFFVFGNTETKVPIVINTWNFTRATEKAWTAVFTQNKSAIDAVEVGCQQCEIDQCDYTVGYGGSPDENGETTLDAMIMDGKTLKTGAVMNLRRIKCAICVARYILEYTTHSVLAGDQATEFAVSMGFKQESLQTKYSKNKYKLWKNNSCQPNFWINVDPDPRENCGPYSPSKQKVLKNSLSHFGFKNHDTIGMLVIDQKGNIASGTSTNGASHKIPGRVGDSPIPGSGSYADNEVGAAAATGDGDIMLRFLPSFVAVEAMRRGSTPSEAGTEAISRIAKKYPDFVGGIVVVNKKGEYGAACHGLVKFPYSVHTMLTDGIHTVECINLTNNINY